MEEYLSIFMILKKKIEMTLKSKSLQKKKLKKAIKELKCINGQNVLKKT
tara:strand:+ start:33950 stop:34096 length:147 start_codon:yes stop_codon:yes gene_type:complete